MRPYFLATVCNSLALQFIRTSLVSCLHLTSSGGPLVPWNLLPWPLPCVESTAWIFPLNFQICYLPEETCFQQAGFYAVEGISQAVLGSSDQQKVPASLSLFIKSEKNPSSALCRKRTRVQALPWLVTCSLSGVPGSGTDRKLQKGLYSGPSPILKGMHDMCEKVKCPSNMNRVFVLMTRCKTIIIHA
jgi:hypothetical protein